MHLLDSFPTTILVRSDYRDCCEIVFSFADDRHFSEISACENLSSVLIISLKRYQPEHSSQAYLLAEFKDRYII